MFNVRFHGRGGQGVVTAAEMLSVAAFDCGRHAQVPDLRLGRTGAPVTSYCRVDDRPIRYGGPSRAAGDRRQDHAAPPSRCLAGVQASSYVLLNTSRRLSLAGGAGRGPGRAPTGW